MKKLIVLILVLLCAMTVLPVSALTANGSFGSVPLYKGGITIDGKKDAAYDLGLKVDASKDYSDKFKTDTEGQIWLLHDGTYLYMFLDVKSGNALSDYNQKYAGENMWNTTCLELMIDWSNDAKTQSDIHKLMMWYTGEITGTFLGLKKEKDLVADSKTTVDKAAKKFTIELKLKMMEGAKTGSEIGFNAMINSDASMGPDKDATRQICATTPGVSNDGSKYLNVTLSSKEVALATTAAATTKAAATTAVKAAATTAAKTADASVVIAAAAVLALSAAVVLKKRK